ncbi:MAG: RodZ domain-containing protein [Gammaproteobacteria bacterium]
MSESETSELEAHEPAAFGQRLMLAREKAGMTIDEAARALNLKEDIVEAIEDSNFERLPPVAFVQGYVRNYAKLLDLSEEVLITEFDKEVPRDLEKELQPRSILPGEADSQTPVIKLISLLIILSAVVVLMYAVYSYYMERSERIEQASLSEQEDAMMQSTSEAPPEQQQTELKADPVLTGETLTQSGEAESFEPEAATGAANIKETTPQPAADVVPSPQQEVEPEISGATLDEKSDETVSQPADEMATTVPTVAPITGGDVLSVNAEQESWAEIIDANDIQLFYGMIKPGKALSLTGQAPFDVFLGNAPAVSLSLNDANIDMTKFIRSNNIAQFKVSVEDGRIRID